MIASPEMGKLTSGKKRLSPSWGSLNLEKECLPQVGEASIEKKRLPQNMIMERIECDYFLYFVGN